MKIEKILKILVANPSLGPDTDQVLCVMFDQLDEQGRLKFITSFEGALRSLLEQTSHDARERELGLNCSAHVLFYLKEKQVVIQDAALLKSCLCWIAKYLKEDVGTWYARGSVLRMLRLLDFVDDHFWRTEFDFWVTRLVPNSDEFIEISRLLMQAIRAIGQTKNLGSPELGALISNGLRAKHFVASELFVALELVSDEENLDGPNVSKNLFDLVYRDAMDASSSVVMRKEIQRTNYVQMIDTLHTWAKECLNLDLGGKTQQTVTDLPSPQRKLVGFQDFYNTPMTA